MSQKSRQKAPYIGDEHPTGFYGIPEIRQETHTRNKKLVFSLFVSPAMWTKYEFRKRETPKLVFNPIYEEWP